MPYETLEDQLTTEKRRGDVVTRFLEDEIIQEVLEEMDSKIVEAFRQCPVRDTEGAMNLLTHMKVLTQFKSNLRQIAETGKLADLQMQQIQREDAA